MAKTTYNKITFDSELEVKYYKYISEEIKDEVINFTYHPKPIYINSSNKYTPDFIVEYEDRIEVIETKGYNQFSFARDAIIHNVMKSMPEIQLRNYIESNLFDTTNKKVLYKKIKYLSGFGWVDFEFKNPNTLANKRKAKINDLTSENKNLNKIVKEQKKALKIIIKGDKSTAKEREWLNDYLEREGLV